MINVRYSSGVKSLFLLHITLGIGYIYLRNSMSTQVEVLGKKYEEKYRQAGDVASKLTIEEATFRDIQVHHVMVIYFFATFLLSL